MSKMLSLRVSDEEYAQLNERAHVEGRTLSNYIRWYLFMGAGIPSGEVPRSTADEELALSSQNTQAQVKARQAGIDQILKGVNRKPKS